MLFFCGVGGKSHEKYVLGNELQYFRSELGSPCSAVSFQDLLHIKRGVFRKRPENPILSNEPVWLTMTV